MLIAHCADFDLSQIAILVAENTDMTDDLVQYGPMNDLQYVSFERALC
jgi:hypothetical protein